MRALNKIILKLYNKEIKKELSILMGISLESINSILFNQCEERSLKVKYILMCKNKTIITVRKKNKVNLIMIHRTVAATTNDYDRFLSLYRKVKAKKAYYICTGVFQQDVYNENYNHFLQKHVVLVDGISFLMKQKWCKLKLNGVLDFNKLSFEKFLPK